MAKSTKNGGEDARQVFRHFAWNLAGTLAKTSAAKPAVRRRRTTSKRVASK